MLQHCRKLIQHPPKSIDRKRNFVHTESAWVAFRHKQKIQAQENAKLEYFQVIPRSWNNEAILIQ